MRSLLLLLISVVPLGAAELTVQVQLRWRGEPVSVPSGVLQNAAGQSLRLTRFAALISDVVLERTDGGRVQLEGQTGFLDAETNRLSFVLHQVPGGDYSGVSFRVGLSPELNHADPSGWPARHALNPIVNGLHWGWAGGYVFAALEGRYRSGTSERGFSYHLATDARLMSVGFASQFRLADAVTMTLALDLSRVLGHRELKSDDGSESTHSGEGDVLAEALARAFERAWFFLGTTPSIAPTGTHANTPLSVISAAPAGATPRAFDVPAGFPRPALPADNLLTVEGVQLGELLFHHAGLSAGARQSCAACHHAERAFSDDRTVSLGVDGQPGTRNAPPLFNLAWSPRYGWDGAKTRLRDQVLAAMFNPLEMHAEPSAVIANLEADRAVRGAFASAFGSPEITVERVGLAIEQYLLTLTAADSKFDRAMRGAAVLTDEEQLGFTLFATEYDPVRGRRGADCFHCHGGALFTDFALRDNGLGESGTDLGLGNVTGRAIDRGKFKTPSLRNVALTAPYMHDGRLRTIEEVVAHYDHGVQRTATLDPNLAKHPDTGLELTAEEQRALVAFLRTLTDTPSPPSS